MFFSHTSIRRLINLFVLLSLAVTIQYAQVNAQIDDTGWSDPVNLSRSGAADLPSVVEDSNGSIHVIWKDAFDDFIYIRYENNIWSDPTAVEFPFTESAPKLVSGTDGNIHAFWIDSENGLSYTQMNSIAGSMTWGEIQSLAAAALGFDVITDQDNYLHLMYINPENAEGFPAGVYYKRSTDGGLSWSADSLIYSSNYFRNLPVEQANLHITSQESREATHIYAVWDNPLRKRVFFSKSDDNGDDWIEPFVVSAPSETTGYSDPRGIIISVLDDNILLAWQTPITPQDCNQYYQTSSDGGITWNKPEIILNEYPGCPQNDQMISVGNEYTLLLTKLQEQMYLIPWDGTRWGEPILQGTITSFEDPETFDMVFLACHQMLETSDNYLATVACDVGTNRDIWFTRRSLGDISAWFPPPSIWSVPAEVHADSEEIADPTIIVDSEGGFHSLWSQPEIADEGDSTSARNVIYYARTEGESWLQPVMVLSSPDGDAKELSVTIDQSDRILVVWSGGSSGQIYFSRVNAISANDVNSWAPSVALPSVSLIGSTPEIVVDGSGIIYVAYAIPLNENRGIYIVNSKDGGDTWSEPVQVFDAVNAQWDMVEFPQISVSTSGNVHLIWTRSTLPTGRGRLGMYSARSNDRGQTWSQPEIVMESPVIWSDVVAAGNDDVHILWQESSPTGVNLWHEYSGDGGNTWSDPSNFTSFDQSFLPVSLLADGGDQVHMTALTQTASGTLQLQYWVWKENLWMKDEGQTLGLVAGDVVHAMASTITSRGRLAVIYLVSTDDSTDETPNKIYFSDREIDVSAPVPTPVATTPPATEQPVSVTPQITPSNTTTPLVTESVATIPPQQGAPRSSLPIWVLLGAVFSVVLLGVAVLLGVRAVRR